MQVVSARSAWTAADVRAETTRGGAVMGRTLAEKVWDAHVVRQRRGRARPALHRPAPGARGDQPAGLRRPAAGRPPGPPARPHPRHRGPQRPDPRHRQADRRPGRRAPRSRRCARNCAEFGVRLHPLGDVEQGIVHVVGPQLGLTQPGMTVVCGDSHTSTHGAFGALAFGIGTSEVEHVLATQTLPLGPSEDHGRHRRRRAARRRHRQGPHPRRSSPRSAPAAARATSSSTAARPSRRCRWRPG